MRRAAILSFALCSLLFAAPLALATDYSSTNFKVTNPVIEELGGFSTSTNFQLIGSIPYIAPVRSTSTSYGNNPGFLGYPSSTASTTASSTPSSTSATPPGSFGGGAGETPVPPEPGKPKPKPDEKVRKRVDFNRDGRVDFIDFSILLYYFDKQGSIIVPFDLNDDGVVDVVDISIFMYYWDGS